MYANRQYSIDDLVGSSLFYHHNNSLNYLVSKSENYAKIAENTQKSHLEYTGQQQKPLIYSQNSYLSQEKPIRAYYFAPEIFLKPIRPLTQFINTTEQVQSLIGETFKLMLGKKMSKKIIIRVCNTDELKQIHSRFGAWHDSIQGFALNPKNKKDLKEIFVKNGHLDSLMLTIGHEIGHVYTNCLSNNHDEEAKAFSFSIEWAKTVKKHNIGNLSDSIKDGLDFNPARNGLHDIAFFFVKHFVNKGLNPMRVHWDLVKGYVSLFGFY
jgi:hypothetical protein